MGSLCDDTVFICHGEKQDDPSVISVSCLDKIGLGCDLSREILSFGLPIVQGDFVTDGEWCYLKFWVFGKKTTRWESLKKTLIKLCPARSTFSWIYHVNQDVQQLPKTPDVFLMKVRAFHRHSLELDILEVFHVLELVIRSTKVSTTPDGRVVDFFIIIDPRELLHTKERKEDTYDYLKVYLGDVMISCEIQSVGDISCYDWDHYGFGLDEELGVADWVGTCSYAPSIIQDMFSFELSNEHSSGPSPTDVNITTDNLSFPSHTLIHITCGNRKGLLYDITRTFKYLDIQICYARFSVKKRNTSEVVFHVKQKDGNKIVDPKKKKLIYHCLQMEILSPIRVAIVKQGIYTELQVANPVELSGIVRPLDVYDLSLALKMLDISVIMVVMMSHVIRSSVSEVYRVQAWEIYRICLSKGEDLYLPWSKIEGEVRKRLME
ncbi:hypothetical protein ACHQM5_016890 [Ranunculus cassubicifolius]